MQWDEVFSPETQKELKSLIKRADGNEIFLLGFVDEDNIVCELKLIAQGNEEAVPAIVEDVGKPAYLIHNHPSGRLTPSDNDLAIASKWADVGLGSCIVDNEVDNVYVIVPATLLREQSDLDSRKLCGMLSFQGPLGQKDPYWEERASQLELLRDVVYSFNNNSLLVAEAGTGVGKSFAYLIPVLEGAHINEERILISTATINLQHQLYEKDLPFLQKILGYQEKAVLVKGRNNYICQRHLHDALAEKDLFSDSLQGIEDIANWAKNSVSGCKTELPWLPDPALWSRVAAEYDNCLGMRCPFRESCFVLRLKREAAAARILVVNHHLLFADLSARARGVGYEQAAVLPAWDRLIIDEAHNIEDSATMFFSQSFGKLAVYRSISRLFRKRSGRALGLLPDLIALTTFTHLEDEFEALFQRLRDGLEELDSKALLHFNMESSIRLGSRRSTELFEDIAPALQELNRSVKHISSLAKSLFDHLEENEIEDIGQWEAMAMLRRIENLAAVCQTFLEYDERPDRICWLERRRSSRGEPWVSYTDSPLEIACSLRDSLFEPVKSLVCLSATLTVERSFNYWMTRSGLSITHGRDIVAKIYPSPFSYKTRVLFACPNPAPLPENPGWQDFISAEVARLCLLSKGSALVLFTSFASLNNTYTAVAPELAEQGYRVLRQGEDDRTRLLQAFKDDASSLLFATDSFWEGVDVPGKALRLVIIARLPFTSPGDPVFEARCEALEKGGGRAFPQLSLPMAVTKLRQGFGRLMRKESDSGAVVVLDGRLLAKGYGKSFVASLPECTQYFGNSEGLEQAIEHFVFMQ